MISVHSLLRPHNQKTIQIKKTISAFNCLYVRIKTTDLNFIRINKKINIFNIHKYGINKNIKAKNIVTILYIAFYFCNYVLYLILSNPRLNCSVKLVCVMYFHIWVDHLFNIVLGYLYSVVNIVLKQKTEYFYV